MICTILIASALNLAPVDKPVFRTIEYFDSHNRMTERVLDRTICDDIERVHAVDKTAWDEISDTEKQRRENVAQKRKLGQLEASERHCKNSVRVGAKNANECNLN